MDNIDFFVKLLKEKGLTYNKAKSKGKFLVFYYDDKPVRLVIGGKQKQSFVFDMKKGIDYVGLAHDNKYWIIPMEKLSNKSKDGNMSIKIQDLSEMHEFLNEKGLQRMSENLTEDEVEIFTLESEVQQQKDKLELLEAGLQTLLNMLIEKGLIKEKEFQKNCDKLLEIMEYS